MAKSFVKPEPLEGEPGDQIHCQPTLPQAVFRLVSVRNYSNQTTGQTMSETTRYTVSVFGKRAEVVQNYLRNGSRVLVEGRLRPDANTGAPQVFKRKTAVGAAATRFTPMQFASFPPAAKSIPKPAIRLTTTIFRSNHA